MIKRIKENLIIDNGFIRVYNDLVSFDGKVEGNYFRYSISERFPNYGVIIICLFEGKIYLQEMFRYAHQDYLIETVKGMGMKDKTPLETATIEVREETGAIIKEIKEIGLIKNDLSDMELYCYVAEMESFSEMDHEETEFIKNLKGYTVEEVKQMIIDDKIQDLATMAILSKFLVRL